MATATQPRGVRVEGRAEPALARKTHCRLELTAIVEGLEFPLKEVSP